MDLRHRSTRPLPDQYNLFFMKSAVRSSTASFPLLSAVAGQRWIVGCPEMLKRLLLLTDRHPDAKGAVDLAIELAGRSNARLTLMHGGDLRHHPAFWTSDFRDAPDSAQARLTLLCLLWDIRQRCPEVGLCSAPGRSPEQVWQAAAQLAVDLIVLPESLSGRFLPYVERRGRQEVIAGAPCPVLVVQGFPE